MKLSACDKLSLVPLTGVWFRALNMRHWKTRLSTAHSKFTTTRFGAATSNNPLYRILYLGENHQVALYEVGALLGDPMAPISNPDGLWTALNFEVRLNGVADLTDPSQQSLIRTNGQELTGSWMSHQIGAAPTQKLGASLFGVPNLEACIVPSAKSSSRNLIVFPDKIRAGSLVRCKNPNTDKFEYLK